MKPYLRRARTDFLEIECSAAASRMLKTDEKKTANNHNDTQRSQPPGPTPDTNQNNQNEVRRDDKYAFCSKIEKETRSREVTQLNPRLHGSTKTFG